MKAKLPQPLFLSVPDAARLCGVSRNTLYTWVRKGKLSAYQTPGRTNLIRPSDLVNFMQTSGLFVPAGLLDLAQKDEANNTPIDKERPDDNRVGILITDDDAATRTVLVRALGEEYKIFQAETGFEALHLLTLRSEIKLVLLDLRMPGQHGLATLSEINSLRPDSKVIIVTGFAGEVPDHVVQDGMAMTVLQKPVRLPELRKAVAAAMAATV